MVGQWSVRFSTLFLLFGLVMYPFPSFDLLPEIAVRLGFDGRLVGGVLERVEAVVLLLAFVSSVALLSYSAFKRRPWFQFLLEGIAALCLIVFLPFT